MDYNNDFGQSFLKMFLIREWSGEKKKLEQWVKGRKSTLDGLKFVRMAEAQGPL